MKAKKKPAAKKKTVAKKKPAVKKAAAKKAAAKKTLAKKKAAAKKIVAKKKPAAKKVVVKKVAAKKKPVAKKAIAKKPAAKKAVAKKLDHKKLKAKKEALKKAIGKTPKMIGVIDSRSVELPEKMLQRAVAVLEDKQAKDIIAFNIKEGSIADYVIIASGKGERHVVSLANYLQEAFEKLGVSKVSIEGQTEGSWVLVDAGDVIVHLFVPEVRKLYDLENLFSKSQVSEDDFSEIEEELMKEMAGLIDNMSDDDELEIELVYEDDDSGDREG
ncbi:MAG: ribosome silencing factor [Alphaproteobacteria bacterium]|nr:ribosome silencing factor [Alphaproteobacteria bacterium]MCL2505985.1 ribosome silencing factor [Alphaproteobacteria bacterium]